MNPYLPNISAESLTSTKNKPFHFPANDTLKPNDTRSRLLTHSLFRRGFNFSHNAPRLFPPQQPSPPPYLRSDNCDQRNICRYPSERFDEHTPPYFGFLPLIRLPRKEYWFLRAYRGLFVRRRDCQLIPTVLTLVQFHNLLVEPQGLFRRNRLSSSPPPPWHHDEVDERLTVRGPARKIARWRVEFE